MLSYAMLCYAIFLITRQNITEVGLCCTWEYFLKTLVCPSLFYSAHVWHKEVVVKTRVFPIFSSCFWHVWSVLPATGEGVMIVIFPKSDGIFGL